MQRKANLYTPTTAPENIFIMQIWSTTHTGLVQRTEKVLPKGTAELIFNLSGESIYSSKAGKDAEILPAYFINGLNFSPVDLMVTQTQYFIGIQFNIFALKYLFNIPVSEFNDRIVAGSLICKSLDSLTARLQECSSFTKQVEHIMSWFREKLNSSRFPDINNRMISLHSDADVINLSVKSISEKYNVCPRHLNRLCLEYMGMCPEDLILYRKYSSALHHLHHLQCSLTEISYKSGFYDQAHFSRTFKSFTGLSPRQYRKSAGALPGHLFDYPASAGLSLQA